MIWNTEEAVPFKIEGTARRNPMSVKWRADMVWHKRWITFLVVFVLSCQVIPCSTVDLPRLISWFIGSQIMLHALFGIGGKVLWSTLKLNSVFQVTWSTEVGVLFIIEGTSKKPNVGQMEGGNGLRQEVNNLSFFVVFVLSCFYSLFNCLSRDSLIVRLCCMPWQMLLNMFFQKNRKLMI